MVVPLLDCHCRERVGGPFKVAAKPFVGVAVSYLGILDNSFEVERLFSKLQLLESKRRANHLNLYNLEAGLVVALHCPTDIDMLVRKRPEVLKSSAGSRVQVMWLPQAAHGRHAQVQRVLRHA